MTEAKVDLTGTEFIVKFEGVELHADAKKRIAAGIQKMVLSEIAHLDLNHEIRPAFPKEWLGIWLDKLGTRFTVPQIHVGPGPCG